MAIKTTPLTPKVGTKADRRLPQTGERPKALLDNGGLTQPPPTKPRSALKMDEIDIANIRIQALHIAVMAIAATMPDDQHQSMLAAFDIQKQYFLQRDPALEPAMTSRGTAAAMLAMQTEVDKLHHEMRTASETTQFFAQELKKNHS
jgi:hypothetical protein